MENSGTNFSTIASQINCLLSSRTELVSARACKTLPGGTLTILVSLNLLCSNTLPLGAIGKAHLENPHLKRSDVRMQTSSFSPFVCTAASGADRQRATIRSMESA